MIAQIVKQIQNDLISALHPDHVENVFNYFPKTVANPKTIVVIRRGKEAVEHEIGQKLASFYRYRIEIIILIAHTDYETGIANLDALEKKVVKNISLNSNLSDLTDEEEGHRESVTKWNLISTEYPDELPPFDRNVQIAIIGLEVDTEIHPL